MSLLCQSVYYAPIWSFYDCQLLEPIQRPSVQAPSSRGVGVRLMFFRKTAVDEEEEEEEEEEDKNTMVGEDEKRFSETCL
ncbi:uncharacterized [Tachysurus ichikawai]